MQTIIDLDKMYEFAQNSIKELDDIVPFVVVRAGEAKYEMMYIDTKNKKSFLSELKDYVEHIESKEYFSVFSAYSREANPDFLFDGSKNIETEEELIDFCSKVVDYVFTSPSESEYRKEVLVVTKHHKLNGMDSKMCSINRTDEGIEFTDELELTAQQGTIINDLDVWNKKQITIQ